jgi:phosphoribosylformylglycinamidine synthase
MGQELGARVELDRVPLKYQGLSYTEIWISESQERMVLSVPRQHWGALSAVFAGENVEATAIGEFTDTKRLELFYKGNRVCDLDMGFLHDGMPKTEKGKRFSNTCHKEPSTRMPKDLLNRFSDFCRITTSVPRVDRSPYDMSAGRVGRQNRWSVVALTTGVRRAVVRPFLSSDRGNRVSHGINFRYGLIDPYWMAAGCIDEAIRQIIAVGGSLKQVAILDNFCWGNPDKPDRLGGLVRTSYGCYDIAKAYGVPFISGKDSLYNEFSVKGKSIAIPGTLLISAIGIMDDVRKAVTMYAKQPGDLIYIVGQSYDEMGGSHYFDMHSAIGNSVPRVDPARAKIVFDVLSRASSGGIVKAMHDCSDGGLGVAVAEMAFSGGLGMDVFLKEVPFLPAGGNAGAKAPAVRNDRVLFRNRIPGSSSRWTAPIRSGSNRRCAACRSGL